MCALGPSQTEGVSLGKLQAAVAQANHLLRFVGDPDKGIDADIEFCQAGIATGARLAVQLKSGASYVSSVSDTHVKVIIKCRHLRYWCCVNVPVLLIYYHPESDTLYWEDVKRWLLESNFDPTTQGTTVIPLPRGNIIPEGCTDKWQRILSMNIATQGAIQERFRLAIPELALFRDPRYLPSTFAFTTERIVVAESIGDGDDTFVQVPPELAPPAELTTTLVTITSHGVRSTGILQTQLGWPEVPFDTMVNDTVPIEIALLYGSFHCRVTPRDPPVRLVCKGYGFFPNLSSPRS